MPVVLVTWLLYWLGATRGLQRPGRREEEGELHRRSPLQVLSLLVAIYTLSAPAAGAGPVARASDDVVSGDAPDEPCHKQGEATPKRCQRLPKESHVSS